jgi:hypothetical protein
MKGKVELNGFGGSAVNLPNRTHLTTQSHDFECDGLDSESPNSLVRHTGRIVPSDFVPCWAGTMGWICSPAQPDIVLVPAQA